MGPVMLDVAGLELSAVERDILAHPLVGGLILFTRNYHDQAQLAQLVQQIRSAAKSDILIAVDHEGGRVQRFRNGFSPIPAMGSLIKQCCGDVQRAVEYANKFGFLMAAELKALDIDISFAPVLDIDAISDVIGDRGFSSQPQQIIQLAGAFAKGMHQAGMKTTGKHFPGHGNVKEDSHIAMPVDRRSREQIMQLDMQIFVQMHQQGLLDAVMPAHVVYPAVDDQPAGFSPVWIQQILRQQIGFEGVVFSDDLSMQGATQSGGYTERAQAALNAGCDMALVCNQPEGVIEVLDGLPHQRSYSQKAAHMLSNTQDLRTYSKLENTPDYLAAQQALAKFGAV